MAGEKKKKSSGKAEKGKAPPDRPLWPYFVMIGVPVMLLALYSAFIAAPSFGQPGQAKPKGAAGSGAEQAAAGEVAVEALEDMMRQIHTGLVGVAGRGDSAINKEIKTMAAVAEDVLARAGAASTEAEKRAILVKGLEARSEMLAALTQRSSELKKKGEDVLAQKNAPLLLDPAGNVAKLTKETFARYVASNPHTMVMFFAPWCEHCKTFEPEYEKVAKQFKDQVGWAAVDSTEEEMLKSAYGIEGYPTLKWFFKGHVVADYAGPRTAQGIAQWVERRLEPAYSELEEMTDLGAALKAGGDSGASMAICAGAGTQGSAVHAAFERVAEQLRGKLLFLWTPAAAAGTSESITVHRAGEEAVACLEEGSPCEDADKVVAWLQAMDAVMAIPGAE